MQMRLHVMALFFYCTVTLASSCAKAPADTSSCATRAPKIADRRSKASADTLADKQKTIFSMETRAQIQREKSKTFYAENQLLKQVAIQRKIERQLEEQQAHKIKVATAEVYEIPVAVAISIDDIGDSQNSLYENSNY